jgi:hypothetical protein
MGRISDAVMNNVLDAYFGSVTPVVPATYYVGLSTTLPTNIGGNVTEPSGNGYTRVSMTNNATNWPASTTRSKSNGTLIQFPAATGTWGTMAYFVIYKSSTSILAADFIAWGALDTPVSIVSGGTPDFPIGTLTIDGPGA